MANAGATPATPKVADPTVFPAEPLEIELPADGENVLVSELEAVKLAEYQEQLRALPAGPHDTAPFWQAEWFQWAGAAVGAILFIALIVHAIHSGSTTSAANSTQKLTSEQAAVAQAQLDHQLAANAQVLRKTGVSSSVIMEAQNQTALNFGTRIVENTMSEPTPSTGANDPVYIVGAASPDSYATLQTINSHAYLASLAVRLSASDIAKNSASVHHLTAEIKK